MSFNRTRRSRAVLLSSTIWAATAFTLAMPAAALAQDAGPTTEVDEVMVTAERRAVSLFTSTTAATVLSEDDLKERGITNLDTLQFAVPALSVSNVGVANLVNIRGVGRTEVQVTAAAGVPIYRDGVPTFNGYFSGAEPYFDIASVEVLKGPQGTFAGQNSTGGAIFVRTTDPSLSTFGGYAQAQVGTNGGFGVQGALNIPLSDTLGIRIAATTERHDSYYDYSGPYTGHPGELTLGAARLTVLWTPTDSFTMRLKADVDYSDQGANTYSPVLSTDNVYDIGSNANLKAVDRFYRLSANLAYVFDNGVTLQSTTGWQRGKTINESDNDGSTLAANTLQYRAYESIFSQELTLVSPSEGRFRYVVGAFYSRDDLDIPDFHATQPPIVVSLVAKDRVSTNYAVFAHLSYDLTEKLSLEVGARYNRAHQEHDVVTDVFFGPFLLASTVAPREAPEDDSVTGKISLSYDINDDNFVYGFIARGYKNNGLNTIPQAPVYDGETVTDFEAGYRSQFFDDRLNFQLAAYYYNYEDYQFIRIDPLSGQSALLNAPGESKSYGVEATLAGRFGDTAFNLAASWGESELATFFAVDPRNPGPPLGPACPVGGPSASPECLDLGGRNLPYQPRWTLAAGVEHGFTVGGGTLTPRLDVIYTDEQSTSVFEGPGDKLDARTIVNGQIGWEMGDWTATAYATNLLNEEYVAAVTSPLRVPGTPRQLGVRLLRRF